MVMHVLFMDHELSPELDCDGLIKVSGRRAFMNLQTRFQPIVAVAMLRMERISPSRFGDRPGRVEQACWRK